MAVVVFRSGRHGRPAQRRSPTFPACLATTMCHKSRRIIDILYAFPVNFYICIELKYNHMEGRDGDVKSSRSEKDRHSSRTARARPPYYLFHVKASHPSRDADRLMVYGFF